jgi:hypothetical protein
VKRSKEERERERAEASVSVVETPIGENLPFIWKKHTTITG